MCTVSWLSRPDGYELFFNRDERRDRPARGPELLRTGAVRYLAPHDAEAGGTWIAVNEFGVTVSMTNQYPDPVPPAPRDPVSRGLLLQSLVDARSPAVVEDRAHRLDLTRFRPFAIAAFAPTAPPLILRWDGRTLGVERSPEDGFVLTSSGASPPGLEAIRRTVFAEAVARGGWSAETLAAVHRSHLPERGPLSVCMHRPEASTVSSCHISVTSNAGIAFRYTPGPPCLTTEEPARHLDRADRLARS
jgi:hypothetical protein